MAESCIEIELTPDQIRAKSDAEKLSLLLELSIVNHRAIREQNELLKGNGKPGLCEQVRFLQRNAIWLWCAFTASAGFLGGTLIAHLNK